MADEPPDPKADLSLVRLMTWLSPAFPVGAFAASHGIETAVREGRIDGEEGALRWIAGLLEAGSGWNDLVLAAEGYRATRAGDPGRWRDAGDLAIALAGSASRRAETVDLGTAFAQAGAAWDDAPEGGDARPDPAYPLAVARRCARCDVPLESMLAALAAAFAATLLSAAQRLVPLGQSAVLRAQRRLEPTIASCARRAARSTLDDLGSASLLSDLCALRHETLQPRLFRS